MDRFISSIRKSVAEENWFSSLFLSLAVPDICGALESPPTGRRGEVSERYCAWFNRYLKKKYDPDSLFDLMSSRSPDTIERMGDEGVARLKAMPANQECAFTAEDCYRFRCKCLHQGLIQKEGSEKFIFITPPPNRNVVHCSSLGGLFQLQIDIFCEDICIAAEAWAKEVSARPDIVTRTGELIEIHHYSKLAPAFIFGS
jgi:hypothetical protein